MGFVRHSNRSRAAGDALLLPITTMQPRGVAIWVCIAPPRESQIIQTTRLPPGVLPDGAKEKRQILV
jgi:hypothetical protein